MFESSNQFQKPLSAERWKLPKSFVRVVQPLEILLKYLPTREPYIKVPTIPNTRTYIICIPSYLPYITIIERI